MTPRPSIYALDERGVGTLTVLAVAPGRALSDDGDQMQRRLDRRRRIGGGPGGNLAIESREHGVDGLGPEDAHAPVERVPVERDDAARRQNGAGQWCRI